MKNLASLLTVLLFSISLPAQQVTNLNDSGPGSLRDAVFNASSGDVIRFDPSLIANGSDTLHLRFTISFLQGVTLKGLYNQTDTLYVSGGDSVQLFYMDFTNNSGQVVILDSLALIDGFSLSSGGAVFIDQADSVAISNTILRSNSISGDFSGGAVYVNAINATYLNTAASHNELLNTTRPNPPSGGDGGALYSSASNLNLMINCKFFSNSSDFRSGGAALVNGEAKVFNSVFMLNYGRLFSGGLGVFNSDAFVSRCFFALDSSYGGGGFYSLFSNSLVQECEFRSNTAVYGGAARGVGIGSNLTVIYSTFYENFASVDGGAITLLNMYGEPLVEGCTFYENDCHNRGGSIATANANIKVSNSTFLLSRAVNNPKVVSSADTVIIQSSIFHSLSGTAVSGNTVFNLGNNIFSDSPSFALSSDSINMDSATISLSGLAFNGGFTKTMLPKLNSPALNAGYPNDFSNAQNGAIFGRRDIGAAERSLIVYDTTVACGPVQWWGATYSNEGVYRDTLFNANSIDSVGILVLAAQDTGVYDLDGTLYSEETDTNTTYQWVDCSNNFTSVPGATNINFLPPSNGQYAVILTNQNCVDTSACYNYNRFSVPENSAGDAWLTFYPNPTTGRITVNSQGALPAAMDILDLSGNLLYHLSIETVSIQLPSLSRGVYLVVWKGETGEVQVDRIVIR